MEYMGAIYVEVDANAVNGVMTLAASGGSTGGSYWINWTANGFTGQGWMYAWESKNVPLQQAWTDHPAERFDNTYEGFIAYVGTGVSDLSTWLDDAGWTNDQKYTFAHDECPAVWMDCTSPG